MRLIIALLLPPLLFLTIGRIFSAIICAVLQFTLVGWPVAALWAVYSLSQYNTDKKIAKAVGSTGGVSSAGGEIADMKAALRFGWKRIKNLLGQG